MSLKSKLSITLFVSLSTLSGNSVSSELNDKLPRATKAEQTMSFWDLPYLDGAYISTRPEKKSDGIEVGDLSLVTKNKHEIIQLSNEIQSGKYGLYDSLLISHKNKLIYESYYRRSRVDLPTGQASATKTLTSLIVGIAIEQGHLTLDDLHKPIINFFEALDKSKFVSGVEKITLHKALTMRGGLEIDQDIIQKLEKFPEKLKGQKYIQFLLEHSKPITDASQKFAYGNFNDMLVMHVLDVVLPEGAEQFIKKELLERLTIKQFEWKNSLSGVPEAGWRVKLTSRDMLKWGSLLLNDGNWEGQQLVSKAYLNKATSAIVDPLDTWIPDNYKYGYFIYQTDIFIDDKQFKANFAWGGGGQYVISVKDLDLVVVIKGHDREDKILDAVLKTVLPAFL
ncbi:serine hydrolase domain-containing protein [Pseudoalteromonas phenolica]|uniref:serine hydrolase domain-containing protein n=1 Tax=Pseudoalteromonas phenolica TaxID=161398 RepID=UPI00110B2470|nr:serine hydrolase [Pseudoalteromonas phenolica]TMO56767.1 hydrolase [Pseudoalteromonas phenolica]